MKDKTGKRPSQGTSNVVSVDAEERIDKKWEAMGAASDKLPDDPDIDSLDDALTDRDDKEAGRLTTILKARYKENWAEISRLLMKSRGRWPGRKKKG